MAKKKYYESENMFLKIDKRISKKNSLYVKSLFTNKIKAILSLDIDILSSNLKKDSVNEKNIIFLRIISNSNSDKVGKKLTFFQDNREDILSTLRIARQYAKDNKTSLYIDDIFSKIPVKEYSNCAFDKETNTVYPILYDEMKELSEHNIPITFQPRTGMKGIVFLFPEKLKANIDMTHNTNVIDISLIDKDNNISYDMSNISFKGIGEQTITIWNKDTRKKTGLEENDSAMNIVSLPEHKNGSEYYYQIYPTKPVIFKDTNLDERNINIVSDISKAPFYTFIKRLERFYNGLKELSEDDKIDLKEKFIFMKQNNCDIIEQSRILLNKIKYVGYLKMHPKSYPNIDEGTFNNKDIERLIGNEIDYEMT